MTFHDDTRGVSIAVTHVLAIAISTILVAGLLVGATTMLDNERERGVDTSLEAVGERLAGEIAGVDRTGASVTTTHPRRVSGSGYSVTPKEADDADDCGPLIDVGEVEYCLHLDAFNEDVDVYVPFSSDTDIQTGDAVRGGPIDVVYDDSGATAEISLEEGS